MLCYIYIYIYMYIYIYIYTHNMPMNERRVTGPPSPWENLVQRNLAIGTWVECLGLGPS